MKPTLLCVANVSRTPQAVELDLSEFNGRVPHNLDGGAAFPPIGQFPYLLTLPPYGFSGSIWHRQDWPSSHDPRRNRCPNIEQS